MNPVLPNTLPLFAKPDIRYLSRSDPVFFSKNNSLSKVFSNSHNVKFFQFSTTTILLSARLVASILSKHILHIIRCGSNKQMIWVYARSCVTVVQDKHSLWNWTYVKFPSKSMTKFISLFDPKICISRIDTMTSPEPTSCCWFHTNISFKSFLNWFISDILTFRHVNPPCRVDVFRAWEKVALLLCLFNYILVKHNGQYI